LYLQEDAAKEDDDDDDDVVCMKEMSVDEVMAAKKQQAILTGNMLDLTEDASPAEMEALAKVLCFLHIIKCAFAVLVGSFYFPLQLELVEDLLHRNRRLSVLIH
jgi:hypothetical protein